MKKNNIDDVFSNINDKDKFLCADCGFECPIIEEHLMDTGESVCDDCEREREIKNKNLR